MQIRRTRSSGPPIAAIFGLLACLLVTGAATAQQGSPVGQVVAQVGAAATIRGTGSVVLQLGATVYRGDRIATDAGSKLEIEFSDGSRLSLGPGTEVAVTDYTPEGGQGRRRGILTLMMGIIRTGLTDVWQEKGLEVRSRAAVASVRSTDWITEADGDTAAVFVVSGNVAVTGTRSGETVALPAGFGTDVSAAGPSVPARWGEGRVRDVLERTRVP